MKIPKIIAILKDPLPLSIFLLTFMTMFSVNYYLMATLPGSKNLMCQPGANLTLSNIAFALFLSLSTSLILSGISSLFLLKAARQKIAISSFSGAGVLIGVLTTFCTFCTLPVISLFGLGISLSAFTFYSPYFKFASLLFLAASIWLLNRQLEGNCEFCARGK